MRTAKSCGPDAPTLASSPREASFSGMTVTIKPVTGESTKETVKPLRGESRMIRLNLWSYLRAFFARTHGCDRHPAFPAPSVEREQTFGQTSGALASRERESVVCSLAAHPSRRRVRARLLRMRSEIVSQPLRMRLSHVAGSQTLMVRSAATPRVSNHETPPGAL
jgi:hypothetical protein